MDKVKEKFATTIDRQIDLLKERGMTFGNEKKMRENLLDIGYYRLGFYWFPFEETFPRVEKRTHKFKEGTVFENVIQLYYFDFDVRNIFLKYISRIEINFRTKLIYEVSNFWNDNPFWYVDSNCVKNEFLESDDYKHALTILDREMVIIRDKKRHNRSYAPSWKAIEFMSLGIVIQLFNNLKDKDGIIRSKISKQFGIGSPNQFSDYMDAIRRLRNSCAHGKVIFDYKVPGALPNAEPVKLNPSQITNLAGTYEVLKYLLSKVSNNRVADLRDAMKRAFNEVKDENVMNIITQNTGIDAKKL
ncbi:MAG: Abi family protein [Prevotella sp.]|nr:Abi family protein [Prevotella sp.]